MQRFAAAILCAWAVAASGASPYVFEGKPQVVEVPAAWSGDAPAPGDRLRIASYNIENFTDAVGDGDDRTPERLRSQAAQAASFIDTIDPDILVLMEIENAASLGALNTALKKPFPVAHITNLGDGSENPQKLNLAVLSRVALDGVMETDFGPLKGPGRPTRGFLRATVWIGENRYLAIYVVHLKSNFGNRMRNVAQRSAALEAVAKDAAALRSASPAIEWEMVVAGDMNIDPEQPQFAGDASLAPLREWKDLWRGRPIHERTTVPTRYGDPNLEFPPACFDRIFVSGELASAP